MGVGGKVSWENGFSPIDTATDDPSEAAKPKDAQLPGGADH